MQAEDPLHMNIDFDVLVITSKHFLSSSQTVAILDLQLGK